MAQAFPKTEWRGYDNSLHALERANANLAAANVSNLSFHNSDEEPLPADGSLDPVTFCEVVHDKAFPQDVLKAVRAALKPDGTVLVIAIGWRHSPDLSEEGGAGPVRSRERGLGSDRAR